MRAFLNDEELRYERKSQQFRENAQRKPDGPPEGYWVCACVKRGKGKQLTHIRMNPPTLKRCAMCGSTKADADRIDAELKAKGGKRANP